MRRERKWFISVVIGVVISASLAAAASRLWQESPKRAAQISMAR